MGYDPDIYAMHRSGLNKTLIAFEKHFGIGPVAAARVLRCAYSTYAQYRSGLRELPAYHEAHIELAIAPDQRSKDKIIQERINGKS